jgi:CRP-like cAMP-binding protein
MYQQIFDNIAKNVQLNQEEQDLFAKHIISKEIKAKTFLQKEGDTNNSLYFVNKGLLRYYVVDANGVEHISLFVQVGWWCGDLGVNYSKHTTRFNIDALADSEVLCIPHQIMNDLYIAIPKLDKHFRILLENSWVATNNRLLDYMGGSAQDRYVNFAKRYPALTNTIAQKQIAAYVGVTPEFLSKLRSQLAKQGLL